MNIIDDQTHHMAPMCRNIEDLKQCIGEVTLPLTQQPQASWRRSLPVGYGIPQTLPYCHCHAGVELASCSTPSALRFHLATIMDGSNLVQSDESPRIQHVL